MEASEEYVLKHVLEPLRVFRTDHLRGKRMRDEPAHGRQFNCTAPAGHDEAKDARAV